MAAEPEPEPDSDSDELTRYSSAQEQLELELEPEQEPDSDEELERFSTAPGQPTSEGVTLTSGRDYLTADGHDTNSHVMADTLMQRVMGATDGERLTRTQLLEHSQYPRDW